MEWPKLKNIILIILGVTNLCLLFFVAHRELRDNQLQRQARQEAIQFLENRGVSVQEDQVPQAVTVLPQSVARDLEKESRIAVALLGEGVQAEDRGAGVYRYSNQSGSIQFHSDGAFNAEFVPGLFTVGKESEKTVREILVKLEFQGELLQEKADKMVFRQLWNKTPVFTQQVTLEFSNGSLTAVTSGRRLVGEPLPAAGQQPITVVTALINFSNGMNALGDVCSQIDGIEQGYVAETPLSGPMVLIPVWRITTDTGAYQLDLLTGELSRVS